MTITITAKVMDYLQSDTKNLPSGRQISPGKGFARSPAPHTHGGG